MTGVCPGGGGTLWGQRTVLPTFRAVARVEGEGIRAALEGLLLRGGGAGAISGLQGGTPSCWRGRGGNGATDPGGQ